MQFISYTKTDSYYEFIGENNLKLIAPASAIILVDDGNSISIKSVASRNTIGYIVK